MLIKFFDHHHNYLPPNLLPDVLIATAVSLLAGRTVEDQLPIYSVQDGFEQREVEDGFGPYTADGTISHKAEHQ